MVVKLAVAILVAVLLVTVCLNAEQSEAEDAAALPHDQRYQILMAQIEKQKAITKAHQAYLALLRTEAGLTWLNAERDARRESRTLDDLESWARDYCSRFQQPEMEYVGSVAQCKVKPKAVGPFTVTGEKEND